MVSFHRKKSPSLLTPQQTQDKLWAHYHDDTMHPRRWIVPRHMKLTDSYEVMRNCHQELLGVRRLWGDQDTSYHAIARYMTHVLQREFRAQCQTAIAPPMSAQSESDFRIHRARDFIRVHFDRGISLVDVAEAVSITPAHLSRIFRQKTGRTVVEMIVQVRLDAAKELLVGSHCSTKEAAYLCGFRSASYFCRVFKNRVGLSPKGYCAAGISGVRKK